MSEECSDYVDCKAMLRKILSSDGILRIIVTKHAVNRLIERMPRKFKKINRQVLMNTIRNIVETGQCKIYTTKIIFWTKNYILISAFNSNNELIIKTVITRDYVKEGLAKAISRGGLRIKWNKVIVYSPNNIVRR